MVTAMTSGAGRDARAASSRAASFAWRIILDPPAFVKSKKDFHQGGRAYRKLARLCAARVRTGGFLFLASCSHHMPAEEFRTQVARGLHEAGRSGRILHATGASVTTLPMTPERVLAALRTPEA